MQSDSNSERIQKYLSRLGYASRRSIEDWMTQGRIKVDGKTATPGDRITPQSRISIDGHLLKIRTSARQTAQRQRVILYNKPEGEICTKSDPKGRPTVFQNLPSLTHGRWISVGRLDMNTSGLLLFTNDGEQANLLMHPSTALEREYLCRVFGEVSDEMINSLQTGLKLDGGVVNFHRVKRINGHGRNTWFSVVIMEGKYREVRRLWEKIGCRVSRLNRIRYGKIGLPRGLKRGGWLELESDAVRILMNNREGDAVYLPKPHRRGNGRRKKGKIL